jgi:protease-4
MAESILDSVYEQFVAGIEERRSLDEANFRAMLSDPVLDTTALVANGLLDGVATWNELLTEELGAPAVIYASEYMRVSAESVGATPAGTVALIYASGPVMVGGGGVSPIGEPLLSTERMSEALHRASEDDAIDAIVIRVDSPGGSALASEVLWQAVDQAAAKRPVVVSFSDVAASGGYYFASAADTIVSHPATLTGSIGVVSVRPAVGGLLDRLGIGYATSTRGEHADLLLATRLPSASSREVIEDDMRDIYHQFVTRVAEGRALDPRQVEEMAGGRIWTGAQAADLGLVDDLGGWFTALHYAKHAAGIAPEADVSIVVYPHAEGSLFGTILAQVAAMVRDAVTTTLPGTDLPLPLSGLPGAFGAVRLPPGMPALVPPIALTIR